MRPDKHVIFGIIFSTTLFFIFPEIEIIPGLLIFFSSVLIDVDHYLYFAYKKKDLSLRRAYKWFIAMEERFQNLSISKKKNVYSCFCFFHGIELLALIIFMGVLVNQIFIFISLGILLHLFLDVLDTFLKKSSFTKFSILVFTLKLNKFEFIE